MSGRLEIPEDYGYEMWQPMETAPKDRAILVCDATEHPDDWDGTVAVVWWDENLDTWDNWIVGIADDSDDWCSYKCEPTHWMELPIAPPEVVSNMDENQ